jgi:hypothetical protein
MGSAHPEIYCPVLKVALRNSVFAQILQDVVRVLQREGQVVGCVDDLQPSSELH